LSFIPANDGPLDYNVVKNHAYTVKSMYTDENGKQWVELYNPWGTNQPAPVPWDEVKDNFNSVYTN
jgi:hypothetical protein